MKILWISNYLVPVFSTHLRVEGTNKEGWIEGLAESVKNEDSISLCIATVSPYVINLEYAEIDGIQFYCYPLKSNFNDYKDYWERIDNEFQPDMVHIHGTESAHGYSYLKFHKNKKNVVSIQGLVSICERYFYSGIDVKDIIKNISLLDIVKRVSVFDERKKFQVRGEIEKLYFSNVSHVIGRTVWDHSHSWAYNPEIEYHFCNETLRSCFYGKKWEYNNCEKHTIFASQASYPLKGFHMLIKSLPYVLREFPNTKVYVALAPVIFPDNFHDKLRMMGYTLYLNRLINKLKVKDNIQILGSLTAEEMCRMYLRSNVFALTSSIENSPNSLGEAQILGVPVISSNVGGVMEMTNNGDYADIYRFEEYEMLAYYICNLFRNGPDMDRISRGQLAAKKRHDPVNNARQLLSIYKKITQ